MSAWQQLFTSTNSTTTHADAAEAALNLHEGLGSWLGEAWREVAIWTSGHWHGALKWLS